MIKKDIKAYADIKWSEYLETVSQISMNKNSNKSLVSNEFKLYNFDSICENLFHIHTSTIPTSVDGVLITSNAVELIEFKSGFKQRITKKNFNKEKGTCPYSKDICKDYWKYFFDSQNRQRRELIDSIRLKAIESYITLEKQILPQCDDLDSNSLQMNLTVVVDEEGVDSMEDILLELSNDIEAEDNCYRAIRDALSRLRDCISADGNTYYYDKIEVMSAKDFSNLLHLQRK